MILLDIYVLLHWLSSTELQSTHAIVPLPTVNFSACHQLKSHVILSKIQNNSAINSSFLHTDVAIGTITSMTRNVTFQLHF